MNPALVFLAGIVCFDRINSISVQLEGRACPAPTKRTGKNRRGEACPALVFIAGTVWINRINSISAQLEGRACPAPTKRTGKNRRGEACLALVFIAGIVWFDRINSISALPLKNRFNHIAPPASLMAAGETGHPPCPGGLRCNSKQIKLAPGRVKRARYGVQGFNPWRDPRAEPLAPGGLRKCPFCKFPHSPSIRLIFVLYFHHPISVEHARTKSCGFDSIL